VLLPVGGRTALGQQQPVPIVRLFVHTEASGDADDLGERRDSVRDLKDELSNKKKAVTTVSTEDGADAVVEVLQRIVTIPRVVIGGVTSVNRPPGTPAPGPVKAVHLKVELRYRKEMQPFTNKNSPAESSDGWRSAAGDIAKQIDKWVGEHRAEILAGKGGLANSEGLH